MALVCTNGKRDRCCAVRAAGGGGDTEPKAEVRYEAIGFTRVR